MALDVPESVVVALAELNATLDPGMRWELGDHVVGEGHNRRVVSVHRVNPTTTVTATLPASVTTTSSTTYTRVSVAQHATVAPTDATAISIDTAPPVVDEGSVARTIKLLDYDETDLSNDVREPQMCLVYVKTGLPVHHRRIAHEPLIIQQFLRDTGGKFAPRVHHVLGTVGLICDVVHGTQLGQLTIDPLTDTIVRIELHRTLQAHLSGAIVDRTIAVVNALLKLSNVLRASSVRHGDPSLHNILLEMHTEKTPAASLMLVDWEMGQLKEAGTPDLQDTRTLLNMAKQLLWSVEACHSGDSNEGLVTCLQLLDSAQRQYANDCARQGAPCQNGWAKQLWEMSKDRFLSLLHPL